MVVWSEAATVTVEVSSAAPDATPAWVDITGYVLSVGGRGSAIDINRGRQNVLSSLPPAWMTLVLDNADSRFTSGYTGSPYYPWWKEHRRIRVRETIGSKTFDLYNGYIEMPTVTEQLEGVDNLVTISAIDRLGRLGSGRKFLSVLGEYILANARGTALKAYYPMGDEDKPFRDLSGNNRPPLVPFFGGSVFAAPGTTAVNPATSTPIGGDDLATVVYETPHGLNLGVEMSAQFMSARVDFAENAIPLVDGEVMTAVIWVKPDHSAYGDEKKPLNIVTWEDGVQAGSAVQILHNDVAAEGIPTPWIAAVSDGAVSGFCLQGEVDHDIWTPLAIRFGYNPSVLELWYRSSTNTAVVSGTPPTTASIATIYCPDNRWAGALAHLQVYVGDEGAFTHDDFLAQVEVGWQGHHRQRTGDRIAMVAGYAGISPSDLHLDAGVASMGRAQLAGRTAAEVMDECAEADRGLLFTHGDGHIVFHDRLRTYNI